MRVLSLGAGVQSSALLIMADRREGPFKDKPLDLAVFSDTQNELPDTMKWLSFMESFIKVPMFRTTRGDLSKDGDFIIPGYLWTPKELGPQMMLMGIAQTHKFKKGRGKRICTVDYKLAPVRKAVREYMGCKKGQRIKPFLKGKKVEMVIGFSTDEALRIKPSTIPWAENWFPLCEEPLMMSRSDCEKYVQKIVGQTPPRSACYFCPLHSDYEWVRVKTQYPEYFEKACLYDEEMRATKGFNGKMRGELFLHKSRKPLREVVFDPSIKINPMINECVGHCGN